MYLVKKSMVRGCWSLEGVSEIATRVGAGVWQTCSTLLATLSQRVNFGTSKRFIG